MLYSKTFAFPPSTFLLTYQSRALVTPITSWTVSDDRFAETGLVRGQEAVVVGIIIVVAAVEIRSPTAAQGLLESYPVSMRHHIVQDRVDGAVREEIERGDEFLFYQ